MSEDIRSWPIGLRRLAEIIGAAATVQLAEAFGGTEKNNIPKKPYRGHPFVNVIGYDNLAALCDALGPSKIDIPRGVYIDSKKAKILDATGSNRDVAQDINCTQRYVRMIRNTLQSDAGQPGLFDED